MKAAQVRTPVASTAKVTIGVWVLATPDSVKWRCRNLGGQGCQLGVEFLRRTEQFRIMFRTHFEGVLDEGELRIVRNPRFGKGRELDALGAQLGDLADYLFHYALSAVAYWIESHCCRTGYGHQTDSFIRVAQ